MPLRKISDLIPLKECHHPDHEPPTMIVLKPGIYEHECSNCHFKKIIVVRDNDDSRLTDDDGTNPMHAWGLGRGD